MTEPAVVFHQVNKQYGNVVGLSNISLTIDAGEFVSVIGSSGSGKTTLLKMINGLIQPTSGEIVVEGKNIQSTNIIELRREIGYVIQGSGLFPHLSVYDNIAYVPRLSGKTDGETIDQIVRKWCRIVQLDEELLKRRTYELSGGQQQRVGIARGLAASPRIVLMDEPFSAVDEITRVQLQDEILRIHKEMKMTIVFITHDIREALKLGTKVLVMNEGKILQEGRPEEIVQKPENNFVAQLLAPIRQMS